MKLAAIITYVFAAVLLIRASAAYTAPAAYTAHARTTVFQAPQSNSEARKLKNPIPSDAASIEEGRKIYSRSCAPCHGPSGKGDGGMALGGSTPADLTDDKWDHGSTDGEIFVVIRDGVSADMEGYKDKLTEKQIWQVIIYIRSIGPKDSTKDQR
jgi:mono/diheme cytochrome c family protein